jgi:hypothetical protein
MTQWVRGLSLTDKDKYVAEAVKEFERIAKTKFPLSELANGSDATSSHSFVTIGKRHGRISYCYIASSILAAAIVAISAVAFMQLRK